MYKFGTYQLSGLHRKFTHAQQGLMYSSPEEGEVRERAVAQEVGLKAAYKAELRLHTFKFEYA